VKFVIAIALVGALACSESKSAGPVPPPVATPKHSDASPEQSEVSAGFCETVFNSAEVGKVIQARFIGTRPAKARAGVAECQYVFETDRQVAVTMAADCSQEHAKFGSMSAGLRKQPGFREVDIGMGGALSSTGPAPTTQIRFEAEVPSCAIYLSIHGIDPTHAEPLARHVLSHLSVTDVPR